MRASKVSALKQAPLAMDLAVHGDHENTAKPLPIDTLPFTVF